MYVLEREQVVASFEGNEELHVPELSGKQWHELDYLGWIHPSGHLGFVVLQSPTSGQLRGIRLSRSTRSSRKRRMEMCSWCHHVHKTNGTAMFTVPVRGSEGRQHWEISSAKIWIVVSESGNWFSRTAT